MKSLSYYKFEKRILVTGGAGFIFSWLVERLVNDYHSYLIINVDSLTYAGNLENLSGIEGKANYIFKKVDIRDVDKIREIFNEYDITDVIHGCAESHVDRSISGPNIFFETNVMGTLNLLNISLEHWGKNLKGHKFINIGTDEIFGRCKLDDPSDMFSEKSPISPHSPYATSKACQYLLGRTYYISYGMEVISTACSNNYGGRQFPEKLIPLVINNLMERKPIPIYGKGEMVRDWLPVSSHVDAIFKILDDGAPGELYCIGGGHPCSNIEVIDTIIKIFAEETGCDENELLSLKKHIPDPRGNAHDPAYRIDSTKIQTELNWCPNKTFEEGIRETVKWYLNNNIWLEHAKSGEYRKWIEQQYGN